MNKHGTMMSESFTIRQIFEFYDRVYKAILNINMTLTDRLCLFASPHQGGGCGLMTRTRKFEQIIKGMNYVSCFLPNVSECDVLLNFVFEEKILLFLIIKYVHIGLNVLN